jgi:phosphatidylserine/phosphatidylglycerophosphate/cardiolipin synthase-like enzyme
MVCRGLHTEKKPKKRVLPCRGLGECAIMTQILIDEEYRKQLELELDKARHEIRIMMYRMQRKISFGRAAGNIYLQALLKKKKEGVMIKVIVDIERRGGITYKENLYTCLDLSEAGIECRELRHNRVCHAKTVIIDSKVAIIGSHNWTSNSFKRNFEVSVKIWDWREVDRLAREFDKIFKGCSIIR